MSKVELVKELRARTQAGMSDCIKALDKSGNDIEKAIVWLRENGAIKAASKLNNAATDGVVLTKQNDHKAVMIEVNTQTDFVAKNEQFLALANQILEVALNEVETNDDFEKLQINNKPIAEAGLELTAIIGEKIAFRRGVVLKANDNQTLGSYTHNNKRVGAIILLDAKVDTEVARNVAMHAAAMRPKYLNVDEVSPSWLANEKEIITNQVHNDPETLNKMSKLDDAKKAMVLEKTVEGRLNKILKENCLVDQSYFKEPSLTIGGYLKQYKTNAIGYFAYEVGDGMEKKPEMSFADEVAAQMKK
ncbi:translation elongation factor Ts [Ureaplasma zalophigenitalium]|uniref:Elongation factor Ts n=1 Tax=Ureaplasma zalophigenitalium TaxID=907723 RepID=A0ABT3BPG8_9BACT|nr:translation elongation factor Ts [Ureaplasma zalophigenitalium]MCV3753903.1 translation elongation factor Ts [Ureaplasma zalophigenitalium]